MKLSAKSEGPKTPIKCLDGAMSWTCDNSRADETIMVGVTSRF